MVNSLLADGAWAEFISIFTGEFAWLTITLMAVGLILCIIEATIPGFGVCGISGLVCEVAAIVVHATLCKGSPIQVLILIALITLVTLLIFLLFVRSARFGMLGKTPIIQNKTAIPENYGKEAQEELKKLIGKEGIIVNECRPIGKMRINDDVFEVSSKDSLIEKGEVAKVIAVEDAIIYVNKITY